jgi:hypothetical protein
MIKYDHRIHSKYLFRPLRSEQEAREEIAKKERGK